MKSNQAKSTEHQLQIEIKKHQSHIEEAQETNE